MYRARDTKLGREVAIKVLPEAFANDAERLARFEREARLLASLNHPNIATIHGLEQSGDARFLVMELVPGETLADRIKKRALPLDEALPLFMQIADGLEAAHEKGVIHRDLKPANIKLTPDEKVKVLDFGLAKAALGTPSGDSSESPTVTHAGTGAGTILGTAGYMSPEQARGKTVDKRTDIWAFGCCLYEALTGQLTFQGDTLSDTLASILRQDPDWQALPDQTPKSIRRLLGRCLQKDPRRRFRDVWDVRIELEEALGEPLPGRTVTVRRPSVLQRIGPSAAVALAVIAVAIWILLPRTPPDSPSVTRLTLSTPPLVGSGLKFDISPDRTRLAFIAEENGVRKLHLRSMDQLDARPVEGTDGANFPFFSPDGEWVGFHAPRKEGTYGVLKKVPVSGGPALTLCECDARRYTGAMWELDDRIYFYSWSTGGVSWIPSTGGEPQAVTIPQEGEKYRAPADLLPDKNSLLIEVQPRNSEWARPDIGVVSLDTGEYRPLLEGAGAGTSPYYAPTGHLVFARGEELRAVPFDLGRLEVTGSPVPVLEGVVSNALNGMAQFAFSDSGTLAYIPGSRTYPPPMRLVWVDRRGEVEPIRNVRDVYYPAISPDGRRIAVHKIEGGNTDVWIYGIARGTLSRLTTFPSDEEGNIWSPDGRYLAFFSNRDPDKPGNLFRKPTDGSGPGGAPHRERRPTAAPRLVSGR